MDPRAQRRILARRHRRLRQSLQVKVALPYLNEEGLLSEQETEVLLNQFHTRQFKVDSLVQWVPQKGADGLDRFIAALRRSCRENRGHGELADLLQRDLDSPDPDTGLWMDLPQLTAKSKATVTFRGVSTHHGSSC